jgi:hypothetical protein
MDIQKQWTLKANRLANGTSIKEEFDISTAIKERFIILCKAFCDAYNIKYEEEEAFINIAKNLNLSVEMKEKHIILYANGFS